MKDIPYYDDWVDGREVHQAFKGTDDGIEAYFEKYGGDHIGEDIGRFVWWIEELKAVQDSPVSLAVAGMEPGRGDAPARGECRQAYDGPRYDVFNPAWDEWSRGIAKADGMVPVFEIRTVPGVPEDAADNNCLLFGMMGFVSTLNKLPVCRQCGLLSRYCGRCGNAGRLKAGLWPVFVVYDVMDVLVCARPGFRLERFYKLQRVMGSRAGQWAAGVESE